MFEREKRISYETEFEQWKHCQARGEKTQNT